MHPHLQASLERLYTGFQPEYSWRGEYMGIAPTHDRVYDWEVGIGLGDPIQMKRVCCQSPIRPTAAVNR